MLRDAMKALEVKDEDDLKTALKKGMLEGALEGLFVLGTISVLGVVVKAVRLMVGR